MSQVLDAKHCHNSGYVPRDGWESLKKVFGERARGVASPETFMEEFGIRVRVSAFISHGLDSDWSNRDAVLGLVDEGNGIDDFMWHIRFTISRE